MPILATKNETTFVVDCAQEKAHQTIREHESMVLSERDRRVFVEALRGDTEPNERLKQAAKRYSMIPEPPVIESAP